MKFSFSFLLSGLLLFWPGSAFSLCVDFDGDGRADSCGSVANIPEPSAPQIVDSYDYGSDQGGDSYQQEAPVSRKVRHSSGPSMQTMVATTIFGSLLEAVFSEPPAPAGPTPEEIAAQQRLEEQRRLEFQRSNRALTRRLKGTTYEKNDSVTEVAGLKLKNLPATQSPSSSGDVHRGFFGSGAAAPTVELLRENMDADWFKGEQGLIEARLDEPNRWAGAITRSLKTKAPPLPYKKFDELQPGDVLLVKAEGLSRAINKADNLLSGGSASDASHTVLYLREVNGVKHFLENVPGQGPRIIFEKEMIEKYGTRGADVAKLAQPLNDREAKDLYSAAVDMAARNRRSVVGSEFLGTNYGVWGKDNVVCSEADWALLNVARPGAVPMTTDRVKAGLGIDFSPADFYKDGQYFLVSPLDMSQR